jgi:hypothetical protein
VEVAGFEEVSMKLKRAANRFIDLNDWVRTLDTDSVELEAKDRLLSFDSFFEPKILNEKRPIEYEAGPVLVFYKVGDFWKIGKLGQEKLIKHMEGIACIHYLLKNPDKDIPSLEVYHHGIMPSFPNDSYNNEPFLIDYQKTKTKKLAHDESKSSLKERLEELNELYEKVKENDPLKAIEIKEEMSYISSQIKISIRDISPEKYKIGRNVQKNIKRAMGQIYKIDQYLIKFLNKSTIKTGGFCKYSPLLGDSPHWILDSEDLPS